MIYPASFLSYCSTMGLKITSLRKSVLFILWNTNKPLKAYEILDNLLKIKKNAKPPTVYRVLDYFVDYGVIHKIESIQSYTLCCEPEKHYSSEVLMVCNDCHQVKEIYDDSMHSLVQKLSKEHLFHLGKGAIELRGICEKCSHLPK
ncbi:MAG: transcriptional repressor [Tatlockia sp.]|nr:transcriptional repressor [Tatlockia sp.]